MRRDRSVGKVVGYGIDDHGSIPRRSQSSKIEKLELTPCNAEVKDVWNFVFNPPYVPSSHARQSDKFLFLRGMRSSGVLRSVEW
jgi:hypothetical protein